jgi:hypothetical protein
VLPCFSKATTAGVAGVAPELSNNVQESPKRAISQQEVVNRAVKSAANHCFGHIMAALQNPGSHSSQSEPNRRGPEEEREIWKKREAEIALGRFQVGWPGERMTFAELCEEFLHSHSSTLSEKSQENHRNFSKHLRAYFGDRKLTEIDERSVVDYRNFRRTQPLRWDKKRTVKGATVNRELACLHCIFQFALKRKYLGENPTTGVKHFDERRERPSKRMLTVEEEHRILDAAPPYLRVAIVLLVQTSGRTYNEGLSLKWDQVDLGSTVTVEPAGFRRSQGMEE